MDPCPFVRLIVEGLALKLPPVAAKPAGSGVHPSNTPCFCTLQLQNLSFSNSSPASSPKTVPLPLSSDSSASSETAVTAPTFAPTPPPPPVVFNLDPTALQRLSGGRPATLTVSVYSGRRGSTCGFSSGRLLGRVRLGVDVGAGVERPVVMHSGWVTVGKKDARLHLVVRSEPEPRFVFQFGGEPECSPVVYQIHSGSGSRGSSLRQPVFSCKFSADRRTCARSLSLDSHMSSTHSRSSSSGWWVSAMGSQRGQLRREQQQQQRMRKGWTVTIHDLSGSPVAAASMVTPFVPSPGSDRVSRSNPGAWLILQPTGLRSAAPTWKPWGRLQAWRERSPVHALGYRFDLVDDPTNGGVTVAQSAISVRRGGEFCIDPAAVEAPSSPSPSLVRCFVMGSTVEREGKVSKPTVQVGVKHVRCMTDAALFVALGAAIDLSMDACRLFSQKLKKELRQDNRDFAS